MRDITQPSFAINPDYITQTDHLKDEPRAAPASSAPRATSCTSATRTARPRSSTRRTWRRCGRRRCRSCRTTWSRSSARSSTRDLLTFLLTPPPSMPRDYAGSEKRPKPRTVAEVNAVLAGAPEPAGQDAADSRRARRRAEGPRPGRARLPGVAEGVDRTARRRRQHRGRRPRWEWPAKEEFQKADAMVFYQHGDWDATRAADIDAFLERGGGLMLHPLGGRRPARTRPASPSASAWRRGRRASSSATARSTWRSTRTTSTRSPGTSTSCKLVDESYWKMTGELPKDRVIAWAKEDEGAAAAVLVAGARQGPGVRVDPRALLVDVRRPAVPRAAAARHRVDRARTGGPLQRPRLAGRGRGEVNAVARV